MRTALLHWSLSLIVLTLAAARPAHAIEVARTATTAGREAITVELGGDLYLQVQGEEIPGAVWARSYEISRALIALTVRYGDLVRLKIEPDFGGGAVGVRDVFLQFEPSRMFDVKVGRVKSPHGWLDNIGRFDLPSLSRGLVTEIFRDRLGFGGRQIAVLPRLRLRDLPLKPWISGGVFGDLSTDLGADGAAIVGVKPAKGVDVAVSWHHRAGALIDGTHGNAASLAVAFDRSFLFAAFEAHLAHASRLRADGRAPTENAGLWALRALVSAPIELHEDWLLGPFVGGAMVDPELGAGNDLGVEVLGGVDLRWQSVIRFGLEVDVEIGQPNFVATDLTRLTAFLGASL